MHNGFFLLSDGKHDDIAWKNAVRKSDKPSETIGSEWITNWRYSLSVEHIFALQRKEKRDSIKQQVNWVDNETKNK